jgi:hypothetical protein
VKNWFQAFAFKWVNLCRYTLELPPHVLARVRELAAQKGSPRGGGGGARGRAIEAGNNGSGGNGSGGNANGSNGSNALALAASGAGSDSASASASANALVVVGGSGPPGRAQGSAPQQAPLAVDFGRVARAGGRRGPVRGLPLDRHQEARAHLLGGGAAQVERGSKSHPVCVCFAQAIQATLTRSLKPPGFTQPLKLKSVENWFSQAFAFSNGSTCATLRVGAPHRDGPEGQVAQPPAARQPAVAVQVRLYKLRIQFTHSG